MKFVIMGRASAESEAGVLPSKELVLAMREFAAELTRAGVLLLAEGLHPSSAGARISYAGGVRTVVDGPFTETKELIAGFWMIQVKSLDEALEWAKRIPHLPDDEGYEIRQVFDHGDIDRLVLAG